MDRVDELKGKARELERSDQPRSALDVYLRLARQTDSEGTGPLWARIGDLQLQLGDPASAQESYSRAIELFSSAGQAHNAIAIALRRISANDDDPIAHLTLGELSLEHGYRDYARTGLASYARHIAQQGRAAEAIGAFTAFLERFPDETRLWKEWVDEMVGLGRDRDAVQALRQLWEHLSDRGPTSAAEQVREAILDIDPSSDPSPAVKRPPVRSAQPPSTPPTESLPLADYDLPSKPASAIAPIEGLEPTLAGEEWGNLALDSAGEALPLLESSGAGRSPEGDLPLTEGLDSASEDLPLLGLTPDTPGLADFSSGAALDGSDTEHPADSGGYGDLPLLGTDDFSAAESAQRPPAGITLSQVVARIREVAAREVEPAEGSTHYDLGIAYKEMGLSDESLAHLAAALEKGHDPIATIEIIGETLVERGALEDAREILGAAEGPGDPNHRSFVGIHYWLARCEEAAGNESAARMHFGRVAEVDPDFRDTRSRLGSSDS